MIGGKDIVFPAVGDSATLEACARLIQLRWPLVRFENAVTGDKYLNLSDIPLAEVTELLAYPSAEAEASWDAGSPESSENSMIYLILRSEDITLVLDNPYTSEMRSILEAVRGVLWTDIQNTYSRAA